MTIDPRTVDTKAISDLTAQYRREDKVFDYWAKGYGVISHNEVTQLQIYNLATHLQQQEVVIERDVVFRTLAAADRISSAALWLVAHMSYARTVYLDGRKMHAEDFKPYPRGHTGGALNMVPAYVGYFAANSLTAFTRSWLTGQGHGVAAIDAVNLLLTNMGPVHAERYQLSNEGLSRFAQDYFSYAIQADGRPDSPLGSHVTPDTAGGIMESGYLGLAELQYVHMPLPGERLVAFLSDGAFEEQRGSDWAPRWWRHQDCGLVTPIMIANGRRIDPNSTTAMEGGVSWVREHLELNHFSPIDIDGHDPASFAWGIIEMEQRLLQTISDLQAGETQYPVYLPYGIAQCVEGFGFPGAGTERARHLPLYGNPSVDSSARKEFNEAAQKLWVKFSELDDAIRMLSHHRIQNRPKERDHALAVRQVEPPTLPEPPWKEPDSQSIVSPMNGVDEYFCAVINANAKLRARLGNPDEIRANHLSNALQLLKHRVTAPQAGVAEAVDGCVITALNEEAVVSAALGNKGGINLVATYEAFAVKMLGALRQELTFARRQREAGPGPGWLAVPVVTTSHTWESEQHQHSHQDPTFGEVMMNEMSDVSRVLFPADWNSAVAALEAVYSSTGQIWTLVIPKLPQPVVFTNSQSRDLINYGAARLKGHGREEESVLLVATGAYQLREVLRASARLDYASVDHAVIYLQEPGRFRIPRDSREMEQLASKQVVDQLFPSSANVRIFLTHTRPEPYIGTIWPLLTNVALTPVLGYTNQGGTLDVDGMLFANRCTWAHAVAAAAIGMGELPETLLNEEEFAALAGMGDPKAIYEPQLQFIK